MQPLGEKSGLGVLTVSSSVLGIVVETARTLDVWIWEAIAIMISLLLPGPPHLFASVWRPLHGDHSMGLLWVAGVAGAATIGAVIAAKEAEG